MQKSELASYLRKLRDNLNLTREAACEGVCEPRTIYEAESGRGIPSDRVITNLMQRYVSNGMDPIIAELFVAEARTLREIDKMERQRAKQEAREKREAEVREILSNLLQGVKMDDVEKSMEYLREMHKTVNGQTKESLQENRIRYYQEAAEVIFRLMGARHQNCMLEYVFSDIDYVIHMEEVIQMRWPNFDGSEIPFPRNLLHTESVTHADILLMNLYSNYEFHLENESRGYALQTQLYNYLIARRRDSEQQFVEQEAVCINLACMAFHLQYYEEASRLVDTCRYFLKLHGDITLYFHLERLAIHLKHEMDQRMEETMLVIHLRELYYSIPLEFRPVESYEEFLEMPLETWIF